MTSRHYDFRIHHKRVDLEIEWGLKVENEPLKSILLVGFVVCFLFQGLPVVLSRIVDTWKSGSRVPGVLGRPLANQIMSIEYDNAAFYYLWDLQLLCTLLATSRYAKPTVPPSKYYVFILVSV